ncbi:hypothetical protein GOP47_0004930 [Adiantum capillus-veneris]|uniref:Uncharacterized protein n=1 Tax=Adiantum capillus-veneris TaxID=13818 RepID=A0A9D4ZN55_ADICA|nr:hypothetical protein GOP47_0004930 [Adiantum capillus-veneris]
MRGSQPQVIAGLVTCLLRISLTWLWLPRSSNSEMGRMHLGRPLDKWDTGVGQIWMGTARLYNRLNGCRGERIWAWNSSQPWMGEKLYLTSQRRI